MVLIQLKILSSGSVLRRFGLEISCLNFATEVYKEDFDFLKTAIYSMILFIIRITT